MMATTTANPTQVQRVRAQGTTAQDWGIFFLRLTLGIIFFMHGSQKVFGWFGGHTLDQSVAGMGHMGIVAPLAYLSIFTELIGGIVLILGVFTRVAAVGLLINMIVAVALVHGKNGFFLSPTAPGYEYNVALIGICIALILCGPGAAGISDLEGKLFKKRQF